MALDDYAEPEVGIAVAVTAALFSPPVRRVLRRGAVYGVAGIMMVGDAIGGLAQGIGRGAQQMTTATAGAAAGLVGGAGGPAPAAPTEEAKATPETPAATRSKAATEPEAKEPPAARKDKP